MKEANSDKLINATNKSGRFTGKLESRIEDIKWRKPNKANLQGVLALITTLKKEDRIDKLEVVKSGCRIGDKSRSG